MKRSSLLISILVILLLIFFGLYLWGRLRPKPPKQAPAQQNISSQAASEAKQDPLLWISDNDSTASISYYLQKVPDDSSVQQNLEALNQDVSRFK